MFRLALVVLLAVATNGFKINPRLDGRIVGGRDTFIEDHPHQISMQYYGEHLCGGSILTKKHIVTAAHCTEGFRASAMSVRVGSSFHSNSGVIIKVVEVLQHPEFDGKLIDNDVSVLVLEEEIEFNEYAQPISLANSEEPAGTICVVTGWGYLQENGPLPKLLQELKVPTLSQDECKRLYGQTRITKNMFCAGFVDGKRDSCQGDSGGPLVANGKLVGIVSWGIGCARPNRPGVYSNVAVLRNFILNAINGSS